MSATTPHLALSIRQPWAWAICAGFKDVENRNWRATHPGLRFRGPALIHAGLTEDDQDCDFVFALVADQTGASVQDVTTRYLVERRLGGIVGAANITAVVTSMTSRWFFGPYGLVLRNGHPLPFVPCRGALGFFRPSIDFARLKAGPAAAPLRDGS